MATVNAMPANPVAEASAMDRTVGWELLSGNF